MTSYSLTASQLAARKFQDVFDRLALSGARLAFAAVFALSVVACGVRGLGDPCIPEDIPAGGFQRIESYVESNSAQCRTRVCLVFKLDGDPRLVDDLDNPDISTCNGAANCVVRDSSPDSIQSTFSEERVFCSCRCRAAADNSGGTPLCSCDDGWHCVDVIDTGPEGLRGGYCVPDILCTRDEDCGGGLSCNTNTNICE